MTRHPVRILALAAMAVLALAATGCRTGADVTMWGPCTPGNDPAGTDGRYAMVCQNGEWTPIMTTDEFVRVSRGEPGVVIAPVPEKPARSEPAVTTTVPPTTAPPVTTTSTTIPAPAAPTITAISHDSGPDDGGTEVEIVGAHLAGVTSVTFGGVEVTALQVISPTAIAVTAPAHPSGLVDVVVTTQGGTATAAQAFEYGLRPSLSFVDPQNFNADMHEFGFLVGYHLDGIQSVTVGGIAVMRGALTGTPGSLQQLSIFWDSLPAGTHQVVVTTRFGSSIENLTISGH